MLSELRKWAFCPLSFCIEVNEGCEGAYLLSKKEQMILNAVEAKAAETGVEIITVEVVGSKRAPIIRIFIDTPNGVSFNELSSAQEWIGQIIEDMDPFPGAYTLEVSSPGIDRPLRSIEHFADRIGEVCRIRTVEPIDGQSNFKGIIESVEGSTIAIESDGTISKIDHGNIKKANIVGKVEF